MNDWKILVEILSGYGILQILEGSCLVVIRLFLHLHQVLSQSGTLLASEELGSKFGNAGKSSFSEDLFFSDFYAGCVAAQLFSQIHSCVKVLKSSQMVV